MSGQPSAFSLITGARGRGKRSTETAWQKEPLSTPRGEIVTQVCRVPAINEPAPDCFGGSILQPPGVVRVHSLAVRSPHYPDCSPTPARRDRRDRISLQFGAPPALRCILRCPALHSCSAATCSSVHSSGVFVDTTSAPRSSISSSQAISPESHVSATETYTESAPLRR